MQNNSGRKLAIAMRCQLLIGSWNGDKICPCFSPHDCPLTEGECREYETHPKIIETKAKNLKEFLDAQVPEVFPRD